MDKWYGAAGVCMNEKWQILMVKQGLSNEEKLWSVPSGGKKPGETYEACCIREIREETGYEVMIKRSMFVKKSHAVEVHYFEVAVIGGSANIQDPDKLIYEIAWKSKQEIKNLALSFPEDRHTLVNFIDKKLVEEGVK